MFNFLKKQYKINKEDITLKINDNFIIILDYIYDYDIIKLYTSSDIRILTDSYLELFNNKFKYVIHNNEKIYDKNKNIFKDKAEVFYKFASLILELSEKCISQNKNNLLLNSENCGNC